MKLTSIVLVVLSALAIPSSRATAQTETGQLAQQSAEKWLALIDSGEYGESWQEAAELFKSRVTKDQWQNALKTTRLPLGKLQSRKVKSTTETKTLPGAPDGQYVVIRYDSSFEQKQSAVETVTAMMEKDGAWRISGYFIK
jgi:Protein of unknown function (DUF4019)